MTTDWLEKIEARWAKATPGKWRWYHWNGTIEVQRKDAGEGDTCPIVNWLGFDDNCRPVAEHNRNASAIAHAPEDIARLVEEVRALRARVECDAEVINAAAAVSANAVEDSDTWNLYHGRYTVAKRFIWTLRSALEAHEENGT